MQTLLFLEFPIYMSEIHVALFLVFQPLIRSFEEFNPKIDEVNELGNMLDALQRGEMMGSPVRRSEYN